MFVLETSQDPSGLAFLERTIFVSFDGENPAASYVVLNFVFPHVHKLKDVVFFRPGLILVQLSLVELLSILPFFLGVVLQASSLELPLLWLWSSELFSAHVGACSLCPPIPVPQRRSSTRFRRDKVPC